MPNRLREMILEMELLHKPAYSEVICRLLDMDGDARKRFVKEFDKLRSRSQLDKGIHDFSILAKDGKTGLSSGISCFATPVEKITETIDRSNVYIDFKKSQTHAKSWLVLFTVIDKPNLIYSHIIH
jgi:hypothetical protein